MIKIRAGNDSEQPTQPIQYLVLATRCLVDCGVGTMVAAQAGLQILMKRDRVES
ncbi:hypothetical protein PM082_007975 [Marasmius tenuissimus]|nr:hypothetical protein PM082_007975 [Marasmius tenuissimus]